MPKYPRKLSLDKALKRRYQSLISSLIHFQTPRGLRAVYLPIAQVLDFRIHAFIKVGVMHETKETNGITHLLEHMMFRGSQIYPDAFKLAAAFEALGGDWNASTSYENTEYWYQGLFKDYNEIINIFADFFMRPLFRDIDIERKIILSEIDGDTNEYGHILDPYFHLNSLYWPNSSLALPILGNKDSLTSIPTPKVVGYFKQFYNIKNTGFCLLGRPKFADQIIELFTQAFSDFNGNGIEVEQLKLQDDFAGPIFRGVENPDNQYEVYLSFRMPERFHPDLRIARLIVNLLAGGYCSWLMRELREKMALAYELDAELVTYHDSSLFIISASVSPENIFLFIKKTVEILNQLKSRGPDVDDLDRAKKQVMFNFGRLFEDDSLLISLVSKQYTESKVSSLLEDVEEVLEVSREQVCSIAGEYFITAKAALLVLGPEVETKKEQCLKSLMNL